MARRKRELADKLGSGTAVPGWRDVVGSSGSDADAAPPGADAMKRKTYLLTEGLIGRVETLARNERVGINELVRYLLQFALDEVESGRHALPTETEERKRIVA